MKKKIFLLPALALVPFTLGACDLLKNDKDVVYDSFESYNSLTEKSYSSSFSFEHDADWELAFLNNSLISVNNSIHKNQEDIELIYSEIGSISTNNFLNVSKLNNDYHISASSLIDQFNYQFELKKDNQLKDVDNLYVNEFDSTSFEKVKRISSFPFESFFNLKESLPKEKFVDVTESIELNDDIDTAINVVFDSKEIKKYLPELKDDNVEEANYTFYIKDKKLKTVEYTYVLDWTNDNKKETITVLTDLVYKNNDKPLNVSNNVSLSKFLDSFNVKEEDLVKNEIVPEDINTTNTSSVEENNPDIESKTGVDKGKEIETTTNPEKETTTDVTNEKNKN